MVDHQLPSGQWQKDGAEKRIVSGTLISVKGHICIIDEAPKSD